MSTQPRMSADQARAIMAEAGRALAEAQALIERHGPDHENGTVIAFEKFYPAADGHVTLVVAGEPQPASSYSYAAIRARGLWYTTGPKVTKGYPWEELLRWIDDPIPSPAPVEVLREGYRKPRKRSAKS
jgi:hypothetical protein